MSNLKTTQDTGTKKRSIKWSPDNIQTFLETYQNYELLWNVRHEDYSNKIKRESSVLKLQEDLISQGLVVPDVAFLRARIKTIKTTYRNELLKVVSSKTSGSGDGDVYTPMLPWFRTADMFLNSVVVSRNSQSNLNSHIEEDDNGQEESISILANQEHEEQEISELDDNSTPIASAQATGSSQAFVGTPFVTPISKKRRISKFSKVVNAINKLQKIATERQASSKTIMDEFSVFGQHIANQLRSLSGRSSTLLQSKFQSLITEEKLKHLPPDTPVPSPFASSSSHQSDEADDLTDMDPDLFSVDDLIYRKIS